MGLGQALPTGSPIAGSRVEPVQSDTELDIITSHGVVRLERRIIVFVCVVFIGRGRDECRLAGEHSPAAPCFGSSVSVRGWCSIKNHH